MSKIKLIALDLDGTLLNSQKKITPVTLAALRRAAEMGIEIVPCTGRFYSAMPEEVRALPMNYAITINGAAVFDFRNEKTICREEIPKEEAIRVFDYLESLSVLYDCYLENAAYMTGSMKERAADYLDDPGFLDMIRRLRHPVPDLRHFVQEGNRNIQKIIMYTKDTALRAHVLDTFSQKFPDLLATSSIPQNVEINQKQANKGRALRNLSDYLGISIEETMMFGDGLNDMTIMQTAGISVCMANGEDCVKAVSNYITEDNDHDGIACALERLVFCD